MPFRQNEPRDEIFSQWVITERHTPGGMSREDNHGTPGISPSADLFLLDQSSCWTPCCGQCMLVSVYTRIRQLVTYGTWMAPESQLTTFNLNESTL